VAGSPGSFVSSWGRRFVFFLVLWGILSEGQPAGWGFGISAAAAAAAFSLAQETGQGIRLRGLIRFAPFFLLHSFIAAVEVAGLAFSPRSRLQPTLLSYRPRLRTEEARVFLANTISLLPGTLTADLWEGQLRLHVLREDPRVKEKIAAVEARVALLFDDPLRETDNGSL
jgi:multicomponent Na+:H+ antiporter subunit E